MSFVHVYLLYEVGIIYHFLAEHIFVITKNYDNIDVGIAFSVTLTRVNNSN